MLRSAQGILALINRIDHQTQDQSRQRSRRGHRARRVWECHPLPPPRKMRLESSQLQSYRVLSIPAPTAFTRMSSLANYQAIRTSVARTESSEITPRVMK